MDNLVGIIISLFVSYEANFNQAPKNITKIRLSGHCLLIETGSYINRPIEKFELKLNTNTTAHLM